MADLTPLPGSRRGRPGRPRKGEPRLFGPSRNGHSVGTACATVDDRKYGAVVLQAVAPVAPRLLDLETVAAYLGLSTWTIRELESKGVLARVRVPLPHAGELRKLLFDRADLDRLIEAWKERPR